MTEAVPRGAGTGGPGPALIPAVSWFEFLLNEHLLENHLSQESPDPSPVQLIVQFLQQAEVQLANAAPSREPSTNGQLTDVKTEEPEVAVLTENRKVKALKLLALKVAAYLKWDLVLLIKNMPLAMVQTLLMELLRVTLDSPPEEATSAMADWSALSDEAAFAIQLYHRWSILAVVRDSFPSKPVKTFVQVPGQMDHIVAMTGTNDTIVKSLKEHVPVSVETLQKCIQCGRDITMPTMHSIQVPNDSNEDQRFYWHRGVMVPSLEYMCQLSYDLGTFYFYQEAYSPAFELFKRTKELYEELSVPLYCTIEESRLRGYYIACGSLQGISGTSPTKPSSLYEQAEVSRRNRFRGMVDILIADNLKQELTSMYRSDVEDEIANLGDRYTMLFLQVSICNVVRGVMEGKALVSVVADILDGADDEIIHFLLMVLAKAMNGASYAQRSNLKCFVWHLSELAPNGSRFASMVVESDLKSYFTDEECTEMGEIDEDDVELSYRDIFDDATTVCTSYPASRDSSISFVNIEQQLMHMYDPDHVRHMVVELIHRRGKTPSYVMALNDKWRVPKEISNELAKLPPSADQAYVFLLVGKACHCMEVRIFERARQLLSVADLVVADMSYLLSKHVRWLNLLADLLQFFLNETFGENSSIQDLIKKAKTCITSVRLGQDIQPSQEVLENCASFLLNIRDWPYLINMENSGSGHIEFCRLLAGVCKELPIIKNARKPARTLWEAVILIFSTNTQHKRTSSGRLHGSALYRDSQLGILPRHLLVSFFSRIKEPTVLSLLVSCLTKFYNILKDDISCEISSDYIIVWSTVLQNASVINIPAVEEAMTELMQHALQVNPAQPSWLHSQADIYYAHSQYSAAMKYYMEAAVVASDFFSTAVPKSIYDEQVYRRMIKCCSYLQCHTQVAVLCQFCEEVDYPTAFKALQERNTYDAMDSYYSCFWDISILEYLVHLHTKRGEMDKRQSAMRALTQLDLNSSNPEDIIQRAVQMRKRKFLRALAKQYL